MNARVFLKKLVKVVVLVDACAIPEQHNWAAQLLKKVFQKHFDFFRTQIVIWPKVCIDR